MLCASCNKKDGSICSEIDDYHKTECYKSIAISTQNLTLCDYALEPKDCLNSIKIITAKSCETINEENIKDQCYSYSATSLQDQEICSKIKDKNVRNTCYTTLSIIKQDDKICSFIESSERYDKNNCLATVAAIREDCTSLEFESKSMCNYLIKDIDYYV